MHAGQPNAPHPLSAAAPSARPGRPDHAPVRARRRTLHPFGATLHLLADDPRVLAACDPALARYPRRAGATGDLHIHARTGADEPGDPAWPVTSVRHGDGRLELHCGSARLVADAATGRADIVVPPALLDCEDALRMLVEGAVSTLLIGGGQLHAVHAGLVQVGGKWLLLRGPSGAGKSTLTYACLRAGARVASDDWVYSVAPGPAGAAPGRVGWLWGYPWRMFLVPEATGRWPELAGAGAVLHPGSDRLKVPIAPPVARRRLGGLVDAVVFLSAEGSLGLHAIDAAEASERFWGPALPTERSGLPPDWVGGLLDRRCYVLQRGDDPDRAAAVLRAELG